LSPGAAGLAAGNFQLVDHISKLQVANVEKSFRNVDKLVTNEAKSVGNGTLPESKPFKRCCAGGKEDGAEIPVLDFPDLQRGFPSECFEDRRRLRTASFFAGTPFPPSNNS
jgi:hypothetical protein